MTILYVPATVMKSQRGRDFFLVNLRDSRSSSVLTPVIIFVAHLASHGGIWARCCEWERWPGRLSAPHRTALLPLSAPFLHLRRTRVTLKARMQRALRRTEINTMLAYYAVAFFSVKSFCRRVVSNASVYRATDSVVIVQDI